MTDTRKSVENLDGHVKRYASTLSLELDHTVIILEC